MATIRIKTRGREEELLLSDETLSTVGDIKQKINSEDPSSVLLTYKDKLLMDSTEISSLESDCIFILETDIEFSHIDRQPTKKYKATINNRTVLLTENEIFFKDGKSYLITNRVRKLKFSDLWDQMTKKITKTHIIHLMFVTFIVASKNYPLMCIIVFINILKCISQLALKFKLWEKLGDGFIFAIFMFFASFIAIDHNKFLSKTR